jgi:hypothetical protein
MEDERAKGQTDWISNASAPRRGIHSASPLLPFGESAFARALPFTEDNISILKKRRIDPVANFASNSPALFQLHWRNRSFRPFCSGAEKNGSTEWAEHLGALIRDQFLV